MLNLQILRLVGLCISPRVADGWGNLPSIGQIDLTPGAEVQRVVFKPTAEDLEALQTREWSGCYGRWFYLKAGSSFHS
ncbi:MAG: hypothetical protein ACLUE2_06620 [Bacteroides cellulosilyticus]